MWGNVALTQAYLTLARSSGTWTSCNRGSVVEEEQEGGVVRYRAAG